ncbi:MAG: bifunctional phosphopantothenoylcysteine decarboxylase/phosphopantothenate--cysteine ligase CoaBC [Deferribacterales bacterium]
MSRQKTNVLVGVTGGIACYKAVHLCRLLIKAGYSVKVVMTPAACSFVTPLTFQSITRNRVYVNEFEAGTEPEIIEHIELAGWADEFIIAPATANTIAKIANGIADNLLTSTVLPYTRPIYIAPAMNVDMYANKATQKNLNTVAGLGHIIIDPGTGEMACKAEGKGRMAEPEEIFDAVFSHRPLSGLKVVVTAGPTSEPIDPVRYITNRSSGKMGIALARQAKVMGADVRLIAGPVTADISGLDAVRVQTADEMLTALKQETPSADILIMAAAVADYKAAEYSDKKIKKSDDDMVIRLSKNPDILKSLSGGKRENQVFAGFAAESHDLAQNARKKLIEKKLDMIVANDISRKDIGFETDDNEVTIFFSDGTSADSGKKSKTEIAELILAQALEIYRKKNGSV